MPKPAQNVNSPNFESVLPEDWELTRFDSVALVTDYVANGSFASLKANVKYKNDQDYAVLVRFTDFTKKWERSFKYVDKHAYDFLGKSTLFPGDVVIANVGDPGKVFRVPNLGQPMTLGPNSVLVRGHEDLDNGFLSYFFMSPWGQDLIAKITTGTAQKKFNKTGLRSLIIPVAPLEQQKRIVAEIEKQFSRLDEAVANLKRVKANLKRYKAAVLKAAVEGKLTEEWRKQHPDVEPASKLLERILAERRQKWEGKGKFKEPDSLDQAGLPKLPKGWLWTSIGQAFEVCIGATPSRKMGDEYWGGKIPWVSSGEVAFCRIKSTRETITELGLKKTSTLLHPVGTILLGMIGEGKTRGQVAILDLKACNNQNSAAIRVSETEVLPDYIYSFLEGEYENTRKRGSGGNQPALNKSRVQQITFPLPPLEEQNIIVSELERRLSNIGSLTSLINANLFRSERLRQSILSKAFSGNLSVTERPTLQVETVI